MPKFKIFFLFLSANVVLKSYSQAPDIEWQKCLGGSNYDDAYSIQLTSDSGYIVIGTSFSSDGDVTDNHGYGDYWVVKLDQMGSIQWQKCYGGTGWEEGFSIDETMDGGFIFTGHSGSIDGDITFNHGFTDCWVVKINSSGLIESQKNYGGTSTEYARSIQQTDDGGYIFAGFSYSDDGDVSGHHGAGGTTDWWVVKLNEEGGILWERSLGGSQDDVANSVRQTSDGGFIVAGHSNSGDGDVTGFHGNWDYWIVKLNSEGITEWQKALGGSNIDEAQSIIETNDGGFIATGFTYSNDGDVTGHHGDFYGDYWVVKLDDDGDIMWQKSLGGSGGDLSSSIHQNIDSSYIVTGVSSTNNDGDVTGHHGLSGYGDYWVVLLDTTGNIKWQKSLGGDNTDYASSITQTLDSGYVIAGYAGSTDGDVTGHHGLSLNSDYWIVKLKKPCEQIMYFADADGDGFGDSSTMILSCFDTVGYVLDSSDCNDLISEIHPGGFDVCNNIDDNCNGLLDEDAIFLTWYMDADADGFGNNLIDSISCFELSGYVFDETDCNDANNLVYPGATEICNSLDENCNLMIDEDLIFTTYYIDADGDNYGNAAIDSVWCSTVTGFITDSIDCDDNDPDIHPGIPEILNGIDDNCNKLIDEGVAIDETIINNIKIYPNPANDILNIDYSGNLPATLEVISMQGQIIFANYVNASFVIINVKEYAPGIYLLKIITENGEASLKFVKQ